MQINLYKIYMYIYMYTQMIVGDLTKNNQNFMSHKQDLTQGQYSMQSLSGLNSELSFF